MALALRRSLVDDVFDDFNTRIRSRDLAPGARLPTEKELAATLNVSRTVIREAVARLAAKGLVVPRQGSGVYVASGAHYEAFQVTQQELGAVEDVIKLLEVRVAIETEMASLAAERRTEADVAELKRCLDAMATHNDDVDGTVEADVAFHRAIAHAAGNQYFERFIDFLGVRLVPSRKLLSGHEVHGHARYMKGIWKEHEAIYTAIAAGDPKAARKATRRHMTLSIKRHRLRTV